MGYRFPAVLIATTLLTLGLIFGFYKIFLDKEASIPSPSPQQIVFASPSALVAQAQSTSSPKSSPKVSPTPQVSKKPLPKKPLIGSITVLQNNLNLVSSGSNISGLIDISGTPPSGSSIVIVARKSGTNNNFQTVVSGVSPQDSSSWTWSSSENGATYDMMAVLKGKSSGIDIDYASSPTYIVTSPAYSQIFSVDVGYAMGAPSGPVTISCGTHYSNNTWSGVVNFPQVTGALMYWLQIGSTTGASDVANIEKNAQTQEVVFNDSVPYYAQYAVSSVSNPTGNQYSSFSNSFRIQCP